MKASEYKDSVRWLKKTKVPEEPRGMRLTWVVGGTILLLLMIVSIVMQF